MNFRTSSQEKFRQQTQGKQIDAHVLNPPAPIQGIWLVSRNAYTLQAEQLGSPDDSQSIMENNSNYVTYMITA